MTDTTVAATSLMADLQPYIIAIVGTLVTAAFGALVALAKKYTGIAIDQATVAKVDALAEQLAAKEIAKASDNLATAQIDVKSPLVKALADQALAALPVELAKLGLGPDDVASKIAAAFGKLQASMTAVPVPSK